MAFSERLVRCAQKIESESGGRPVVDPAMQRIELCNAI
jgi:hypothetical protein